MTQYLGPELANMSSQAIQHFLVIEDDKGQRMVTLEDATCSIGRDSTNKIVLYSNLVSRQHAILLRVTLPKTSSHLFRIIDGNLQGKPSTNGLIINGKRCQSRDLKHKDVILFGEGVRVSYYATANPSDLQRLTCCKVEDVSAHASGLHNPFATLVLSDTDLTNTNESAMLRLASFPEFFFHPIIEINLAGQITYVNPAAAATFLTLREERMQHPILAGVLDTVRSSQKNHLIREVKVGDIFFEQTVHYIAESDLIRTYAIDVTDRKQAQVELQAAHDQLEIRVEERTAELKRANTQLKAEIAERQRAEEEVSFLQTMTQAIGESPNFWTALTVMLHRVCEFTQWEYGEAWLPTRDGSCLRFGPVWHQPSKKMEKFRRLSESLTLAMGVDLPGRGWASKQPEWIQNLGQQPESVFGRTGFASEFALKTGISVPVVNEDQVLAILVFFSLGTSPEDQRLVQLVSTAAAHLASLMHRKQAEDALHSSMFTNRALLNAIPDSIFRISTDGVFVNFKEAKNSLLPLPTSDFLGKNLNQVFPLEVAEPLMACIKIALKTRDVQILEYQLLIGQNPLDFETRIAVSAETEVMAIIRDITERKKAETEIRNALEKERALNELKTRFVSMTSHEFRTPLTSILSSAELLEHYNDKWSEEKKKSYLKRIQTAVKRLTELLNDILLIGKGEAGRINFSPQELDFPEFCLELIEEIEISTQDHQINFTVEGDYKLSLFDPKLLRNIISNLLSNAVKYSPKGGEVSLEVLYGCETLTLWIKDSGIGIPPAEQTDIFNSFNRASNVGTISGNGLGLAIVKNAVDMHRGNIQFESIVDVGTTFTITFPLIGVENDKNSGN